MTIRVFAPDGVSVTEGARLDLDAQETHYLLRVRRAKIGARIEVFDGQGGCHFARVTEQTPRFARVTVDSRRPEPPPAPPVTILLGLPEPQAALSALVHACVGGAAAVILVQCENSHGQAPSAPRTHRVLRAAQRQCGRPDAPSIRGPMLLEPALDDDAAGQVVPGFVARASLAGLPGPGLRPAGPEGARLLIGPEGGLTDDEADRATARGFTAVGLGPWTLRTESAVLAGLAQLLASTNSVE